MVVALQMASIGHVTIHRTAGMDYLTVTFTRSTVFEKAKFGPNHKKWRKKSEIVSESGSLKAERKG